MTKDILHIDANNFYASCELIDKQELKNCPVAICPNLSERHSIILAKNEIAKNFGIKTGEPKFLALKKCKNLVFIEPNYDRYVYYSKKLFKIYCKYTDRVESFGIDECWLDITESKKLFGSPIEIAKLIANEVKKELGLTVSIGISFTKYFSKIGSDYKKPDAITVISKENYKKIVWPLLIENFLMIGAKTKEILNKLKIYTIGDLANSNIELITKYLGIAKAKLLIEQSNGKSNDMVKFYYEKNIPYSISHNITLKTETNSKEKINSLITSLSEMVFHRINELELLPNGVSIIIRDNKFKTITRQVKTEQITSVNEFINHAKLLFEKHYFLKNNHFPIRLIGLAAFDLKSKNDGTQLKFNNLDKLDEEINKIRTKYGFKSIQKGIVLNNNDICSELYPKDFYAFRDNYIADYE